MNTEENKELESWGKILAGENGASESGKPGDDLMAIWSAAGKYQYTEASGNDKSWSDFQSKLNTAPALKVTWLRRNFAVAAASAALLLAAGGAFWFFSNPAKTSDIAAMQIRTGNAEIKKISLSDGSTITLNSNSEVTIAQGFNETNRNISLVGQADFEVAKNETLPFEVKAGKTNTRVLGTGFDILAYPNENVRIVVKHGKVRFGNTKGTLTLTKGQGGVYAVNEGKFSQIQGDTNSLQWHSGEMVFKKANLGDIATAFKHRFGKTLQFSEKDGNRQFTGKFDSGTTAEQVVATLKEALQVQLTIE